MVAGIYMNSSEESLENFVKWIAGSTRLLPNEFLRFDQGFRPAFQPHTCFKSLDIPDGSYETKEGFLSMLQHSLDFWLSSS